MTNKKVVIALGGNAIQTGNGATSEDQQQACFHTAQQLEGLIKAGYQVVVAHGNGPQVGNIVLQNQMCNSDKLPAMPLDVCGAMSQGMIGYWLQNSIREVLTTSGIEKDVATIVTQVAVDASDKAFKNPTKPIGSFYSTEEAEKLMDEKGYVMIEDAGRGHRRVVPSPKPTDIVEKNIIKALVDQDAIVVATGGGGIPVIKEGNKYVGVEAVIDKDFASEKLAELIEADLLIILTAVEKVAINYGKPEVQWLSTLSLEEANQYIEEGHFAPGSMLPKVQAAMAFAESKPGRKAIITSLDKAINALNGETGTIITQVPVMA